MINQKKEHNIAAYIAIFAVLAVLIVLLDLKIIGDNYIRQVLWP